MWYLILFLVALIFGVGIFLSSMKDKQNKARKEALEETIASVKDFEPTQKVMGIDGHYAFMVDDKRKKVCYINDYSTRIIPYGIIMGVEVVDDGQTIFEKSAIRTVGGALAGGVIAGNAGAVIGGLSGGNKQNKLASLVQVKLRIKDINSPVIVINAFNTRNMTAEGKPIKVDSLEGHIYLKGLSDAQKIADIVGVIVEENKTNTPITSQSPVFIADELKKLADLKKDGVLTEEEFNQQKTVLLGTPKEQVPDEAKSTNDNGGIEEQSNRLKDLVKEGKIIDAVVLYREATGCSMAEADAYIDSLV